MVATRGIAVAAIASREVANIHGGIHRIDVRKVGRPALNRSLSVVVDIDCSIHVLVVAVALNRHAVLMLNRVARSSVLPLLAQLGLGNRLDVGVSVGRVLGRGVHA